MQVQDIIEELDYLDSSRDVFVEVNGVVYEIHSVTDDSQGVYINVDASTVEREMR